MNDSWASGRLAAKLKWIPKEGVTVTDTLEYFPNLEDGGYLSRNEAALTTALGAGWSMKLAHILQYASDPEAGVKKTDTTLIVALQYTF